MCRSFQFILLFVTFIVILNFLSIKTPLHSFNNILWNIIFRFLRNQLEKFMKFPKYVVTLLATILFVLLFFEKSLGLNVAIYGISTIILLVVFKTEFFKPLLNKIVGGGFLITSVMYYLFASPFTLTIAILSFILLFGLHVVTPFKSILYAAINSIPNYFKAFGDFFDSFSSRKKTKRTIGFSKTFRIIFLPLFVIFLFIALYSMGSSFFSDALGEVGDAIGRVLNKITQYINIVAVFVGILGLLFAVIHSLGFKVTSFSENDAEKSDLLTRVKDQFAKRFKNLDLLVEYKSGIFLFATLSLMLIMLLYLEIKNIWFGFEWDGELLKDMVHEGTYVLIIAILVSMAVTIYYFRKNLNFYSKNKPLKILAYIWIGLNALLVISVFFRNSLYIEHFGLAYKRIGVVFFLVLCIVGLATLAIKIAKLKSTFYVIRNNALVAYLTLIALCLINWDVIIAKYNYAHYKTAFIHLPYMSSLSDKALPYLELTDEEIAEIEAKQVERIPFARRGYFEEVQYKEKISKRIRRFKQEQKDNHWLESVWAEEKAFNLLNKD